MEKQLITVFEDVPPIKHGDFRHVSFQGCTATQTTTLLFWGL